MKLFCDENVKDSVYNLLHQEGYDVRRVRDVLEAGDPDWEVIEHCRRNDAVLLTNDDDFFAFDDHPGILFLDEQLAAPRAVVTAIQRIEETVGPGSMADTVWHVPDGWV